LLYKKSLKIPMG